jgi:hypothetical protein
MWAERLQPSEDNVGDQGTHDVETTSSCESPHRGRRDVRGGRSSRRTVNSVAGPRCITPQPARL